MEDTSDMPEIQKKTLFGVELTNCELSELRMITDYLVLDKFGEVASFLRFEKCFGPLFTNEKPKFLVEVFKEICGEKKKYIDFRRIIMAYLKWKSKKSKINSFNKFMDILFNKMIKRSGEVVGNATEGQFRISTRSGRPRKVITKFGVYTDKLKNNINGFQIQYDECFEVNLSKEKSKENISLEINFQFNTLEKKINRNNMHNRDGISHILGIYSEKEKIIKFLIFKCRSGKTFYIGDNIQKPNEKYELFLFGTSSCQLKTLRVELEKENNIVTFIEPKFQPSISFNQNFNLPFEEITEEYLNQRPLIFEENELSKFPLEKLDEINNILIPCIKDEAFLDMISLKEEKCGKDFNEVYKSYLLYPPEKLQEENQEKLKEEKKEKEEEIEVNMEKADAKRRSSVKCAIENIRKNSLKRKFTAWKEYEKNASMDLFLAKIVKFVAKAKNKKKEIDKEEKEKKEKEKKENEKKEEKKENEENEDEEYESDEETIEEEIEEESEEDDDDDDQKHISLRNIATSMIKDEKLRKKLSGKKEDDS